MRRGEPLFDLGEWHVARQLHGKGLTVATHGAHAHADAVNGNRAGRPVEDLVALGHALPFLAALAVAKILVDPGQQAAGERMAEVADRKLCATEGLGHRAVDVSDGAGRVVEQVADRGVRRAHLRDELTHLLRAGARSRLIGHRAHPFDQPRPEETRQRHEHQADGAVAADEITAALRQAAIDDVPIHGVEHHDRIVGHPERGGCIDPVAAPAGPAKLRVNLARVVAALAGDEHVAGGQFVEVPGVLQPGRPMADVGCGRSDLRGREEDGVDDGEVALGAHPLEQHRTHHAAPSDEPHAWCAPARVH